MLGFRIVDSALAHITCSRPCVAIPVLQFSRPDTVFFRRYIRGRLTLAVTPRTKRITAVRFINGFINPAGSIRTIQPVGTRVIENNVEDNPQTFCMGCRHQINKVLSTAEPGIHLQEILNTVAMIRVQMFPLLENGTEP